MIDSSEKDNSAAVAIHQDRKKKPLLPRRGWASQYDFLKVAIQAKRRLEEAEKELDSEKS